MDVQWAELYRLREQFAQLRREMAELFYDPDQPRGDDGKWGDGGSGGDKGKGDKGMAASDIVSNAPPALQNIIDNAVLEPTSFGRSGIGGTAAYEVDGKYIIPVNASHKPAPSIVVHEATHAHQDQMVKSNPAQHDAMVRDFESAAMLDNAESKSPLWSNSLLNNGSELWATATGYQYGGSKRLLQESSPRVSELVKQLYESDT